MLELAVTSRIARDLSARQFASAAPRPRQAPATATVAPLAPVRRGAVHVLRRLADRLEPASRRAAEA